jgi:hypothetical protein
VVNNLTTEARKLTKAPAIATDCGLKLSNRSKSSQNQHPREQQIVVLNLATEARQPRNGRCNATDCGL